MSTDREALAAAVRERLPRGTYNPAYETDADDIVHALMPVVDRIANERAAAELRAAADDSRIIARTWQQSLLARADALDPTR